MIRIFCVCARLADEISPSGVGKGEVSVITSAEPNQQFVSIDGKRTYINLFGSAEPTAVAPQSIKPTTAASGLVIIIIFFLNMFFIFFLVATIKP